MFIGCPHESGTPPGCLVTYVRSGQCGRCPVSLTSPYMRMNVDGLQHFTFEHYKEMNVTKIELRSFDSQAISWQSLLRCHQKALGPP